MTKMTVDKLLCTRRGLCTTQKHEETEEQSGNVKRHWRADGIGNRLRIRLNKNRLTKSVSKDWKTMANQW